jgi:hypothetical protein
MQVIIKQIGYETHEIQAFNKVLIDIPTSSKIKSSLPPPRLHRVQNLILRRHILGRSLIPNRNINSKVLQIAAHTRAIKRKQSARDGRWTLGPASRNRNIGRNITNNV